MIVWEIENFLLTFVLYIEKDDFFDSLIKMF